MNTTNRFNHNDDNINTGEPWLSEVVDQLRAPLSDSVSAQLREARRFALNQPVKSERVQLFYRWGIPTLASVFAIMVTLNVWNKPEKEPVSLQTADSVLLEDLPIFKASDDWELYKNIEFLNWMEQDENGLNKG